MHFFDDSLLPETQEKLVIQAAPYGPAWRCFPAATIWRRTTEDRWQAGSTARLP